MTREEAIKSIKLFFTGLRIALSNETKEAFNTLIPELAESVSEDERTRRELVKFISDIKSISESGRTTWAVRSDDAKMCETFLAYLEKQKEPEDKGEVSDGYHTFNELYYYRMLYNASFFNELAYKCDNGHWDVDYGVHKSKRHHDGKECLGGGWFIVMANLPTGQISNHYELKYWDLFQIPEKETADEWDGHTPQEAAERLYKFLQEKQKEQKLAEPSDEELQRHQDELYDFMVFAARQAKEHHISFVHDFEWYNFCAELLSYFNEKQKPIGDGELNALAYLEQLGYTCIPPSTEKQKEQKPAEWSEDTAPVRFEEEDGEKYPIVDYKLMGQKPAEWSEEDEKHINSIFNDFKQNVIPDEEDQEWLKNRFKFLHTWKPSNEQMYILNWVANILLNHDGIVEEEVSKKLQSLYNDLKKLM